MILKDAIAIINQMQADGVIGQYAIGGAVGAGFYIEPATTLDVDIFVSFRTDPDNPLISLKPIYDYLTSKGCPVEKEYVVVAGWPVQFLPPDSPLVEEAIAEAASNEVDGVPLRVFSAEHLAAIALKLGRGKDYIRAIQFVQEGALDMDRFRAILARHGLQGKWSAFEERFLKGSL
jgi:hypothetical protein